MSRRTIIKNSCELIQLQSLQAFGARKLRKLEVKAHKIISSRLDCRKLYRVLKLHSRERSFQLCYIRFILFLIYISLKLQSLKFSALPLIRNLHAYYLIMIGKVSEVF